MAGEDLIKLVELTLEFVHFGLLPLILSFCIDLLNLAVLRLACHGFQGGLKFADPQFRVLFVGCIL